MIEGAAAVTGGARRVRDLIKHFPIRRGSSSEVGAVRAVDGVSFDVIPARRSGLSASRLRQVDYRAAAPALMEPTSGSISSTGQEIAVIKGRALKDAAARHADDLPGPVLVAEPAQDGRHDHRRAVRDPRIWRRARATAGTVQELMDRVGLNPSTTTATRTSSRAASASSIGVARALRSSRR